MASERQQALSCLLDCHCSRRHYLLCRPTATLKEPSSFLVHPALPISSHLHSFSDHGFHSVLVCLGASVCSLSLSGSNSDGEMAGQLMLRIIRPWLLCLTLTFFFLKTGLLLFYVTAILPACVYVYVCTYIYISIWRPEDGIGSP